MSFLRTVECNLRRREQRARESLDERFQRRSVRNTADRLKRARARSEQQMTNRYTECCHDGKVRLPNLAETPDLLKELLTNNSLEDRNYQQHIREFNVASMRDEVKAPPRNGQYCFRIHGQIYHRIAPLYSNEKFKPGYGQLYVFDASEANWPFGKQSILPKFCDEEVGCIAPYNKPLY
ncbi:hypothetical protein AVEN_117650-1 [Araneus ventricosus]|uniref:Helitron helicase-like domain-containing protein n=1 Tax=Araneus ventricosus TaxID=182803 RepID=A0A4Y2H2Q5_ARAVE|nr:hypothetical protein AVEN_117650-1 [Araneus ventricosus]